MILYCMVVYAGKDYPVQASTRDEMLVWLKAISDAVVSVKTATIRMHACTHTHTQDERQKRPSDSVGTATKNPAARGGSQESPIKKNGASGAAAKPVDTDDTESDDD